MTHRIIAGLDFLAHSPSLLEYHGCWLGFDGTAWRVAVLSAPWGTRRFPTRHEAALLIYDAFHNARENLG